MKTTFKTLAGAALAVLAFAFPAAAQEPTPDSVAYQGQSLPVWVAVEDAPDGTGTHRVRVLVRWDDHRSTLRFATDVLPGELLVFLPRSATAEDLTEVCVFASGYMAHESQAHHPMESDDANCTGPPVAALAFVAVEHSGDPLACVATEPDGEADPSRRMYACYFDRKPGG